MNTNLKQKVKISKTELLETLRENKAKAAKKFEKEKEEYLEKVIKFYKERQRDINFYCERIKKNAEKDTELSAEKLWEGQVNSYVETFQDSFSHPYKPIDESLKYDEPIKRLELLDATYVELEDEEFRKYVMDDWHLNINCNTNIEITTNANKFTYSPTTTIWRDLYTYPAYRSNVGI